MRSRRADLDVHCKTWVTFRVEEKVSLVFLKSTHHLLLIRSFILKEWGLHNVQDAFKEYDYFHDYVINYKSTKQIKSTQLNVVF